VPHHENFGQVAKPIEYILAWVPANVDQPFKALECDKGSIHIEASILGQQGKPK
jgi:hypothetical protein